MENLEFRKKQLEYLKKYCYAYIEKEYGKKQNYIRKTKITKNGLFVYGHKVYSPLYCEVFDIYVFISWYDDNNYDYIHNMLDMFVNDCERLNEYKGVK